MPRGVPKLGQQVERDRLREAADIPVATEVGALVAKPAPIAYGAEVDVTELPPPWETDPQYAKDGTDARRFVDVPMEWELRWINPRVLQAFGWRDWMPLMASDPRVTVKVASLVDVGGNLRRGGPEGDILAFMPKHWVESRKRLKAERAARLVSRAGDRQHETIEQVEGASRGYVRVDSATHPTHTIGEGKTMTD